MIDFDLPEALIAQEPARPRDSARLLVYNRKTKTIMDTVFRDVDRYIDKGSTLILNNAKVDHCRWLFDDGKTEIFVLDKLDTNRVRALVRPGRKFHVGKTITLTDWLSVETQSIEEDGSRLLHLSVHHDDERLLPFEHVPLPPYIKQDDSLAYEYQTVYAKTAGSKAAPTAGLHFTDELLRQLSENHPLAYITLHVGLGTFAPLTDTQLKLGKLHEERYSIDQKNLQTIRSAKHITAVGTTTTRTLETVAGRLAEQSLSGSTGILIQPSYNYQVVDSLITNFHLPGTSLLLMVEAFVGSRDEMQRIYDHAITERYRFYSFGDAMLVL